MQKTIGWIGVLILWCVFYLSFDSIGMADELVVTETGNVGINTDIPTAKLQIKGSNDPVPLQIGKLDNTGAEFTVDIAAGQGLINLVGGAKINAAGNGYDFLGTRGASRITLHDGSIKFFTSNSTVGTPGAAASGLTWGEEKLVLNNEGLEVSGSMDVSGNLGVGTSEPAAKLDLNSNSNGIFGIRLGRSGTSPDHNTWKIWNMDGSYGNDFEIWQYPLDGSPSCCIPRLEIKDDGTTNLVPYSGNVGVGTTNPAAKLDVKGNIQYKAGGHTVQMTNTPGYLEYVIDGAYYGVSIWASSRRFKENIRNLEISSEQIYALNPVSFQWIEKRGGKEDFGLIAEEVAKTIPTLALYDEEGKPFSVRYELLSVLLLKELKSQQKINNDLIENIKVIKSKNAQLKNEFNNRIREFENRMAKLEAKLSGLNQ